MKILKSSRTGFEFGLLPLGTFKYPGQGVSGVAVFQPYSNPSANLIQPSAKLGIFSKRAGGSPFWWC